MVVDEIKAAGMAHLQELNRMRPAGLYLSVEEAQKGKASIGTYRESLWSMTSSSSDAVRMEIRDGGLAYGPWLEGTDSRNQSSRFKGYATFRQTETWLETEIVPQIVFRAVTELNTALGM